MSRAARHRWTILVALAAATGLAGCKEVEKADKQHYQPATLSPLKGDDEHFVVTLTPEGAKRISVATGRIRASGAAKLLPYTALLYEKDGSTYVYVNPKRLTYHRAHVEVERIAGDQVVLRKGPAVGTAVVTTGAAQIHGAELEYGEY